MKITFINSNDLNSIVNIATQIGWTLNRLPQIPNYVEIMDSEGNGTGTFSLQQQNAGSHNLEFADGKIINECTASLTADERTSQGFVIYNNEVLPDLLNLINNH